MHGNRKNVAGFTFVELVVIIVILGILSIVVMPRLGCTGTYDARGYYDAMVAAARYARNYAVASGCPVTFATDGTNKYALTHASTANCSGGLVPLPGPDMQPMSASTAYADISPDNTSVKFLPDGSTDLVSDTTFTVSLPGHFSDSFTIHAATGYVEVN